MEMKYLKVNQDQSSKKREIVETAEVEDEVMKITDLIDDCLK